jgi:general stress protein YciG
MSTDFITGGTMSNINENEREHHPIGHENTPDQSRPENKQHEDKESQTGVHAKKSSESEMEESIQHVPEEEGHPSQTQSNELRPMERPKAARPGARGTAAMDPQTRKEVARKGGLAVSRNKQHMAEIGRKGGQSVSKNREHMAQIGRKGGAASRGHR